MRILHFEYSDFFRKVVHDMCVRQGFDYIESSDGSTLFKMLGKYDIDVILTGTELADMNVEELLQELNGSKYENIPVVILTSSDVKNIKTRLKTLKFDDFILKESLTLDLLTQCIKRVTTP